MAFTVTAIVEPILNISHHSIFSRKKHTASWANQVWLLSSLECDALNKILSFTYQVNLHTIGLCMILMSYLKLEMKQHSN